jgi:hypothetical protein
MNASPVEFADILQALRSDSLLGRIFAVVGKSGSDTSYRVARELGRSLDWEEMNSLNQKIQILHDKNVAVVSIDPIDSMNRYVSLTPRGIELYTYLQKERFYNS